MKPDQFDEMSDVKIKVNPNLKRRIQTAMKKGKGLKICLKPDEDLIEGGKISLKKIGKDIKKGFNKNIVDSGVGKDIAKGLIRTSTGVLLPAAGTAASILLGDPTGMSGGIPAQIAGQELQQYAEKKGYGVYKSLAKVGIKKKDAQKIARDAGKMALRGGARAASIALTNYTGNPKLGKALEDISIAGGDKLIDSGSGRKAIKSSAKVAKRVAVEAIDDYVDTQLTGIEREVAQKALAGAYPSAADLVYDYGTSKIEYMKNPYEGVTGAGIVGKSKKGIMKVGGRLGYKTLPIQIEGGRLRTDDGMQTFFPLGNRRSVPESADIIQLGSPYQSTNSPAMSPFISGSPQLAAPIRVSKSGGAFGATSFLPAKMGGSFVVAGGRRKGQGFVPAG